MQAGEGDPVGLRLKLNVWRYIQRMDEELSSKDGSTGPVG